MHQLMCFVEWILRLCGSIIAARPRRPSRCLRRIEQLELRVLLTDVNWIAVNGAFGVAGNWLDESGNNVVPDNVIGGDSFDVKFNRPNASAVRFEDAAGVPMDAESTSVSILREPVTFDFSGKTYSLAFLEINDEAAGALAELGLLNGHLMVGGTATVGSSGPTGDGRLEVIGGAIPATFSANQLIVGAIVGARGEVWLNDATADVDNVIIGGQPRTLETVRIAGGTVELHNGSFLGGANASILVANGGHGTLLADTGSTLQANVATIGAQADPLHDLSSGGRLILTGAGTSGSINTLTVGDFGRAELEVRDGASLETTSTQINANQSMFEFPVRGDAIVKNAQWSNLSDLDMANGGGASLTVSDGGSVVVGGEARVGLPRGSAQVYVDGALSLFQSETMIVGVAGPIDEGGFGEMNVTNSGFVQVVNATIGDSAFSGAVLGSGGIVTVEHLGSRFNSSGMLKIGGAGTGRLVVDAGGTVLGVDVVIGASASSRDSWLKVSQEGSSLTANSLVVGSAGKGDLIVDELATVNTVNSAVIGALTGSEGLAVVADNGQWDASPSLTIGGDGKGTLKIISGGKVFGTVVNVGKLGSVPDAQVIINGAGAQLDANGGTINVGSGGGGNARFEVWNSGEGIADNVVHREGGKVIGDSVIRASEIASQGNDAGILPGDAAAIAVLTFDANWDASAGVTLFIDIAGASNHDVLAVTGDVGLGGILNVSSDGYEPSEGDQFEIVTVGGSLSGEFDLASSILPSLPPGLRWDILYGDNDGDPENEVILRVVGMHAMGSSNTNEGEPYVLTLDSGGDVDEWSIDWGDGSPIEIVPGGPPGTPVSIPPHVYADENPSGTSADEYTVVVTATVDGTVYELEPLMVIVNNVNPTLSVIENQSVQEGMLLSLIGIGTFTDPGFDTESFDYEIDWGDGSTPDAGAATIDTPGEAGVLTEGSFDGSHTYASGGLYTVMVTIRDDDGGSDTGWFEVTVAPTVTIEATEPNADEVGPVPGVFRITRTGNAANSLLVYFDVGGSADSSDYTMSTSPVELAMGENFVDIQVWPIPDGVAEIPDPETVVLTLTSQPTYIAGSPSDATVFIADAPLPTISVDDPGAVMEGDMITFTVSLSFAPATTVTVDYVTTDGTATSMPGFEDYWAASGTLTFMAGETTQTVMVSTVADGVGGEGTETFTLDLSNPSGATILDGTGIGTINDAPLPELSVDDPVAVTEGDMITFTVSLSFAPATTVTVDYITTDGTATSMPGFEDYWATSGTLTFMAGETTQSVMVSTVADGVGGEGTETFTLDLSNPGGATILDGSGTGTIDDAPALTASSAPVETAEHEPLRVEQLESIVSAAVAYWHQVVGDSAVTLENTAFAIADLHGLTLAVGSSHLITIDVDAAGHGWFIDATPGENSEYILKRNTGQFEARPYGPADGRMDLLTVVLHELGHVLGFDDLDSQDDPFNLMSATLEAGVRRLPTNADDSTEQATIPHATLLGDGRPEFPEHSATGFPTLARRFEKAVVAAEAARSALVPMPVGRTSAPLLVVNRISQKYASEIDLPLLDAFFDSSVHSREPVLW